MQGNYTIQVYIGSGPVAEKFAKRIDAARGNTGISAFVRRAIEAELVRVESRRTDDEVPQ